MLKFENIEPKLLAYDRPSPKLIGFLRKHFHLVCYVKQNNNFVVFNEYFDYLNSNKYRNKLKSGYKYDTNNCDNKSNFASIGQNLMYNPAHNNNVDNLNEYNNYNSHKNQHSNTTRSPVYTNNNVGFSNYFLNQSNTNYYDQIYSKKKLQLLNDFIAKDKLSTDEYVK
jgi:hypothetical protein